MAIDVSWTMTSGAPPTVRGRVVLGRDDLSGAASTSDALRRLLVEAARASAERLQAVAQDAYPTIKNLSRYTRWTSRALFTGLAVRDREFFHLEWDTRPHWPPFGKASLLATWAESRGMEPRAVFFIARHMAPVEPTNVVVGPYQVTIHGKVTERSHRMTVAGLGGYDSQRHPGKLVATSGKYALSDALDREADFLATRAAEAVTEILARLIPES